MRFLFAVVIILVLMVVTLKLLGHPVPILDYPVGPLGAPLIQGASRGAPAGPVGADGLVFGLCGRGC